MVTQFKVRGLKTINRNITEIRKKIKEITKEELEKAGQGIYTNVKSNIKEFDLTDTKDLLNSAYRTQAIRFGDKTIVEIGITEKHGVYHEFGWDSQNISSEMIENIRQWSIRKLGVSETDSWGIAYSIAMNLAENGHEASPFMNDALEAFRKKGLKILGVKIKASLSTKSK